MKRTTKHGTDVRKPRCGACKGSGEITVITDPLAKRPKRKVRSCGTCRGRGWVRL